MIDRHRTNLGTDPTIRCETSVWVRRKQKARNAPNTSRDDNKDSHPSRASTYSSRNTVNMANSPVTQTRLKQICNDACDSTLSTATSYDHSQTAVWNNSIINSILKALISESSTAEASSPKYKFCVNITIIQHLSDPRSAGAGESSTHQEAGMGEEAVAGESGAAKKVGRRGMHSAS
ncbi:hypothetical protein LTR33_001777 [Friedmanniomyces endolithicus]|nr:hypothetical protein LTR33_001777 [Friedmanniomyces endolithicus]